MDIDIRRYANGDTAIFLKPECAAENFQLDDLLLGMRNTGRRGGFDKDGRLSIFVESMRQSSNKG